MLGGNIVEGPVYNELTPVLRSVIPDLYHIYTIVMKIIISIQNVTIIWESREHFHKATVLLDVLMVSEEYIYSTFSSIFVDFSLFSFNFVLMRISVKHMRYSARNEMKFLGIGKQKLYTLILDL